MCGWDRLLTDYVASTPYSRQAGLNASIARRFFARFDSLTVAHLQRFLLQERDAGLSLKTLCNHRACLSRFCRWLKDNGHLPINPCKLLDLERPHEQAPLILSQAEVEQLIGLARAGGILCQVSLALHAGLRISEIRRLKWADVNLPAACLTVRRGKGRRPRVVPLAGELAAALADHRAAADADKQRRRFAFVFPRKNRYGLAEDAPYSEWWYIDKMKPMAIIPSIARLPHGQVGRGWHALRHTFASRRVQANVSVYKVSRWLGHRGVTTTERYAHLLEAYDPEIESAPAAAGGGRAPGTAQEGDPAVLEVLRGLLAAVHALEARLAAVEALWR